MWTKQGFFLFGLFIIANFSAVVTTTDPSTSPSAAATTTPSPSTSTTSPGTATNSPPTESSTPATSTAASTAVGTTMPSPTSSVPSTAPVDEMATGSSASLSSSPTSASTVTGGGSGTSPAASASPSPTSASTVTGGGSGTSPAASASSSPPSASTVTGGGSGTSPAASASSSPPSASTVTGGGSGTSPAVSPSATAMTGAAGTTATATPTGSSASTATPGTGTTQGAPTGPPSSTEAQSTVTPTTAAPTTTPTTTPKPSYPTKQPEKPFQLSLPIGNSRDDALYCLTSCNISVIVGDVQKAFSSVPGYLYVRESSTTQRRKRDTQFTVEVLFQPAVLTGLSESRRMDVMTAALDSLNGNAIVVTAAANGTIVVPFVAKTADVCNIAGVCGAGYRCEHGVCFYQCEGHDCGGNGVCNTIVNSDGTSGAQCVCNSDDEYTYSGPHCKDKEMSKAKVAAIVGGVLGAFCGLFLLIIIFLLCRLRGMGGGDKQGKYQLGGYSNNGYAEHDFDMKGSSTENP